MKKMILIASSLLTMTACVNKKNIEPTVETVDVPVVTKLPIVENDKQLPDKPYPLASAEADVQLTDKEKERLSIAERFKTLDMDNVVKEVDSDTVLSLMNGGTGIVFFGNELDDWSKFLIYEANMAAQTTGNEVFLHDISSLLGSQDSLVQSLETFLGTNRVVDSPSIMYVNQGKLVGYYSVPTETDRSQVTPTEYYTSERLTELENRLFVFSEKVGK